MHMLFRLLQFTLVFLQYLKQANGQQNVIPYQYISYHVNQDCAKKIMAEFIMRENLCHEYNQKNKQKILQNIITSQLMINNQKIELNNISEILQLVEQIKPIQDLTRDQMLLDNDPNEISFINQIKQIEEFHQIKKGQFKQKNQDNLLQMMENSLNKNINQIQTEENYFNQQQEQMKQYQSYFQSKLSLLDEPETNKKQEENQSVIENELNNKQEYLSLEQDQYNENQISLKQEKDPNFWKQQLEWLKESFQNEKNNYEQVISKLQKDKDQLQSVFNSIKNKNEKFQEKQDLQNLINVLETINLDLEPLKLIQSNSGQQQKDL
ncbi:hypothetical protein ABPG74_008872 [Tetrahymena malaccensis]